MSLLKSVNDKIGQLFERAVKVDPFSIQEGGDHYKDMPIQPAEFIYKNDIGYLEGCVIKYICRHKRKGGSLDLHKAKHYIDMIMELEYRHDA